MLVLKDLLGGLSKIPPRNSKIASFQRCPTYQLHFSPKRRQWGPQNPKSGWAGKFREIQGFCRISTETLDPGNSGKFILGTPFLAIWGDFPGEMRMAKVDMLGRGEPLFFFWGEKNSSQSKESSGRKEEWP